MQRTQESRYNIVVKNRPGELAKLTKLLSDAGMSVSGLRIANLGDRSSIQFAAPRPSARRHGRRGEGPARAGR